MLNLANALKQGNSKGDLTPPWVLYTSLEAGSFSSDSYQLRIFQADPCDILICISTFQNWQLHQMRFPKSKGQTAPTAMPGEFSPWLLLLAASLGWKQAMLWQQAMISKGLQEKCPQEQDLHWLRHKIFTSLEQALPEVKCQILCSCAFLGWATGSGIYVILFSPSQLYQQKLWISSMNNVLTSLRCSQVLIVLQKLLCWHTFDHCDLLVHWVHRVLLNGGQWLLPPWRQFLWKFHWTFHWKLKSVMMKWVGMSLNLQFQIQWFFYFGSKVIFIGG